MLWDQFTGTRAYFSSRELVDVYMCDVLVEFLEGIVDDIAVPDDGIGEGVDGGQAIVSGSNVEANAFLVPLAMGIRQGMFWAG